MIRHLRLSNWRAYDSLDVSFEPGTTFVVAPNGVGKTSLILAVAWGLYGEDAKTVQPGRCVRAGTDKAEVEVTVELRDTSTITITRTVTKTGRSTEAFHLHGEPLDAEEAKAQLTAEFGVDFSVAARLSLMVGGGHVDADRQLDLEAHLHHAFGVADLLAGAKEAETLAKTAVKARKAQRETNKQQLADRNAVIAEVDRLADELEDRQRHSAVLESSLADADKARTLAADWDRYHLQVTELRSNVAVVADQVGELLGDKALAGQADRNAMAQQLTQAQASLQELNATTTRQLTENRATTIAAQNALQLLEGERHICPTCLREFDADSIGTARTTHHELIDQSELVAETLQASADDTAQRLADADGLLAKLQNLPLPEPPSADPAAAADTAEADYQDALAALSAHNEQVGTVSSQLSALRQDLKDDEDLIRDRARLHAAYRREGLALAAKEALHEAAEQLTSSRIEPIATQVQWRWKQLFSEGGLRLRPDGTITRLVADEELDWDSLSGGERIWARLITHLLVIESSTRLPLAWFDEPLEHLDPKLRRTVAGYLATATNVTGPSQLIVTTYEHDLASQLAADNSHANIVYLR